MSETLVGKYELRLYAPDEPDPIKDDWRWALSYQGVQIGTGTAWSRNAAVLCGLERLYAVNCEQARGEPTIVCRNRQSPRNPSEGE